MTEYQVIEVVKVAYLFGWFTSLCVAMTTHIPKRTALMDSMVSVLAVLWPIFLVGTYIYLLLDTIARELPASGKGKDDSHGNS